MIPTTVSLQMKRMSIPKIPYFHFSSRRIHVPCVLDATEGDSVAETNGFRLPEGEPMARGGSPKLKRRGGGAL
jgi:hypothetical protein